MNLLVALFRQADDVLRRGSSSAAVRRRGRASSARAIPSLLIVAFGIFYGGLMGTYGGVTGREGLAGRLFGVSRCPLLLIATLPAEPSQLLRTQHPARAAGRLRLVSSASLLATQAGLTVILACTGPVDGVLVRLGLRLSAGDPLQRPDVRRGQLQRPVDAPPRVSPLDRTPTRRTAGCCGPGSSSTCSSASRWAGSSARSSATRRLPVQFFREDSWSNAYVVVLEMVWRVLTRAT